MKLPRGSLILINSSKCEQRGQLSEGRNVFALAKMMLNSP